MTSARDAIVTAAADLLDLGGPDGVTLREVGKRARLSHNAPYKHYRDKEALLAAVAVREFEVRHDMMSKIVAKSADPLEGLRQLVRWHVTWAMRYPHRFHLLFGRWTRHDDALDTAAGETRRYFVDLMARVRALHADWPLNDERTSALLLAVAHGAIELALAEHIAPDGKGQATPTDLVQDAIDLLATGRIVQGRSLPDYDA